MMFKHYRGELILLLVTLIAASGWFFSKNALTEFPTMGFIGWRFLLAFFLYLPFSYSALRSLSAQQVKRSSAVGFCYTIYLTLWMFGLINSQHFGEGAFLVSLSMLIVPLLAWLFFQEKPNRIFWLCFPIALSGLYLLAISKGELYFSLGSLIFLSSSLAGAVYFVLNNRFSRDIPVLPLTTLQVGIVGLCCSLYSICFENYPEQISLSSWLWFSASVIIATNARMLLQTWGQKYCDVSNAAIIMILEPVWTMLLSLIFLGEHLTWLKVLGCSAIFIALVLYRLPILQKKK